MPKRANSSTASATNAAAVSELIPVVGDDPASFDVVSDAHRRAGRSQELVGFCRQTLGFVEIRCPKRGVGQRVAEAHRVSLAAERRDGLPDERVRLGQVARAPRRVDAEVRRPRRRPVRTPRAGIARRTTRGPPMPPANRLARTPDSRARSRRHPPTTVRLRGRAARASEAMICRRSPMRPIGATEAIRNAASWSPRLSAQFIAARNVTDVGADRLQRRVLRRSAQRRLDVLDARHGPLEQPVVPSVDLAALVESGERVLAKRLEQSVPVGVVRDHRRDERLLDEPREQIEDVAARRRRHRTRPSPPPRG